MKCNILLRDWIVGIINSILKHPLDTPEWSVKKYPIFIPRSEVPPLEMTSSKQLTQIPCVSLNEYLDELVWIFKLPKVSIPILVNSGINQPLSIPILAVCESNKFVNIFTKNKNISHYILKKKFCSGQCPTVTTFLTYISPLIADTQLKTVSTEFIDSSTSRQSQDTEPSQLEKYLAKHILDSTQRGMSTVLLRMDESGVLHDMKKITLEENIFSIRNIVIKKPSQDYPLKSEGHQNTNRPCSELTRTKLKERLEGKDADIVISEDDGNNSFLQKSGQDETTQNRRNIPETSHKDETTEDNTDMFDTCHTEGQQTQDNTHLSETSEMRDEIKEDYTEGETTQDGTHISETSEMQDQTEKQDQRETQDQTETQDQRETQDETEMQEEREMQDKREMEDQTETQDETEIQFKLQIKDPSHRQGSTTEDQTNISHREDQKETAQGQDPSHRQGSTTEDQTNISHREDQKETAQGQDPSHRQGSTTEDQTNISHREDQKETAQGQDPYYRQGSTTEDQTNISDIEDQKETAQGQDPSHRQGSTTEDQTNISHIEDQKETPQGQDPSHRQGSTTEDRTKRSHRENRKEKTQGQVSDRQGSTTENNTMVLDREDGEETAEGQVSQGQGSTTEDNREIANRKDGKETGQGRVSYSQGSTTEDNREITNRKDGKEAAQGLLSHRQASTTGDNREEEGLKEKRGIFVTQDNQLIPNRNKDQDRFNNNSTLAEDFRSSDSKEVRTTNPGAMNYNSTSQSTAQMNPYGNNDNAFSFPAANIHTSTPINEAGSPFMDPMMDNLYSENVMRNFSLQPAPSGNPTSTIFGNANSILYGMDNYLNDVPQQGFHSTEECNIGNNIKIRISIDSKIPVEISQEQEQHEHMPSNSFCKPWQNDTSLTNSLHHGKEPSTDDKGIRRTSEIGINCKPYKINMKRHGKYSFTKTGDDKLPEVQTPKERKQQRRDSLDSCCQTPSDWKEPTNYDINNLLQERSTEESTTNSRKNNSTSFRVIDESRPIVQHIQQTKWKQVTTEEIKENQQQTQRIKRKKAANESIKGNEVTSKSSERKPSMELKNKTFRKSEQTERSRNRNDTLDKPKNQRSCNDRKNEAATIKGASKRPDIRSRKTTNEDNNVTIDSTDDNDADDEEDESGNLQTNGETEPSDEEEINQFTSGEKQFQETNNTDDSNDDYDAGSEEGGSVLNEDRGDQQVEVQRDDEGTEEERDDQDQEEDDEGEDTESVKTYVKSIIPFDDDERNPHATSSPRGNITIMLHIFQ